jgi:hypothetical protein
MSHSMKKCLKRIKNKNLFTFSSFLLFEFEIVRCFVFFLSCLCLHFIFSLLKRVEEGERSQKLYHHSSYYIKPTCRCACLYSLSAPVACSLLSIVRNSLFQETDNHLQQGFSKSLADVPLSGI